MYLYKVGSRPGVLIKQGVLISEVSLKRGSTVVSTTVMSEVQTCSGALEQMI